MSDRGTVQIPLLSPIIMGEGEACRQINHTVRWTDRLTDACRCRMEQLEKIHKWLAGYVQAVGIMLQIPGAAEYRFPECAGDEHLWDLIWSTDTASTLSEYVTQLVGGLRQGMGYCGVQNFEELRQKGRFVRVTAAGVTESHPHNVVITKEPTNYAIDYAVEE